MNSPHDFPKIAIYGLGAISLTIVHALVKNEIPFTILCQNQNRLSSILNTNYKFIFLNKSPISIQLESKCKLLKESQDHFDFIFLGCKQDKLIEYKLQTERLLNAKGQWILIQNGIPEEQFKNDQKRMIGGVVGWNTKLTGPDTYTQTNKGALILGKDTEKPSLILKTILEPYIPVILTENLTGYRWHKLGINSIINGLAAAEYLSLGPLFLKYRNRKKAIQIISEIQKIIHVLKIKEEVIPGSISLHKLGDGKEGLPSFFKHVILLFLGIKYYKIRTSMVQDLDKKQKTEIDFINGHVVKIGKSLGIPTPNNEDIVREVKRRETDFG